MIRFMSKPLLFTTTDNNTYCYDNSTRIVFPVGDTERQFLQQANVGFCYDEDDFIQHGLSALLEQIRHYRLFQSAFTPPVITEQFMEEKIRSEGTSHLCLIVTDACNFRCKYCIYSDHYYYSKSFANKHMSFDTAKASIDYFMDVNRKAVQYNPNLDITIGFYGGETLLNWKLIRQVVQYTEQAYSPLFPNLVYSITTNAYLLSEENIDYMLEHRFSISVSLDGHQQNHDRNRVTIDNKPTFAKVFDNLQLLERIYQEKTAAQKPAIPYGILITYDNLADFDDMEAFFASQPDIDQRIQRVSRVSDMNTSYYDDEQQLEQFSQKRSEFINQLITCSKNRKFEDTATQFSKTVLKSIIFEPMMNLPYNPNELRGTCLPGLHKLAVDAEGRFHMCEKINPHYPIGDINHGLDIAKQAQCMNEFFTALEHCADCNLSNVCNLCYVITETDGKGFQLESDYCKRFREGIVSSFSTYYSILESNPHLFHDLRD